MRKLNFRPAPLIMKKEENLNISPYFQKIGGAPNEPMLKQYNSAHGVGIRTYRDPTSKQKYIIHRKTLIPYDKKEPTESKSGTSKIFHSSHSDTVLLKFKNPVIKINSRPFEHQAVLALQGQQGDSNNIDFLNEIHQNPLYFDSLENLYFPLEISLRSDPYVPRKDENGDILPPKVTSGKILVEDGGMSTQEYYGENNNIVNKESFRGMLNDLKKLFLDTGRVQCDVNEGNLTVNKNGNTGMIDWDLSLSIHDPYFDQKAPKLFGRGGDVEGDGDVEGERDKLLTIPDHNGYKTVEQFDLLNQIITLYVNYNHLTIDQALEQLISPNHLDDAKMLLRDPYTFHQQYFSNGTQLFLADMLLS